MVGEVTLHDAVSVKMSRSDFAEAGECPAFNTVNIVVAMADGSEFTLKAFSGDGNRHIKATATVNAIDGVTA